jgi:hypothetical protein
MYRFNLWIRLSGSQTTNVIIMAAGFVEAKMLGEAQYGVGNVISCSSIDDY